MKLRAHKVIVIRDEMTRIPRTVWHWELPLLQAAHPDGYVIDRKIEVEEDRDELPDAAAEYARLTAAYGREPESKRDYTEMVLGYGAQGVKALGELLKESVVGAKPSKKKKASKKKATAKKAETDAPDDPLE